MPTFEEYWNLPIFHWEWLSKFGCWTISLLESTIESSCLSKGVDTPRNPYHSTNRTRLPMQQAKLRYDLIVAE